MDFSDKQSTPASFQIAPMIDIVFLLLIWLIVSYAVAQEERNLRIRLPRADAAEETTRQGRDVVVDVAADGSITHQNRPMTLAQLESRLTRLRRYAESLGPEAEPGVILRVDGDTAQRSVVAVLNVCRRSGVHRVLFATEAEAGESG